MNDRGSKRIEGIGPILGFAHGRDNTFTHCLEIVLDALGRKVNYDELMGLSGLAFRIQFRVDRWDVGNPDPLVGEECVAVLFNAIGVQYQVRVVRREELTEAEALRKEIIGSIDRGLPVLASNIIPPEDWGIISGYRGERSWFCRAYRADAQTTDRLSEGWPTAVIFIEKLLARPAVEAAHKESIRRAIMLFDKRNSEKHAIGSKAYDYWCEGLRTANDQKYTHANMWTYIGLIDARMAAVRYLRSVAKEFGSGEKRIIEAADYYDQEVRMLRESYKCVSGQNTGSGDIVFELRKKQIEVLLRAKAFEEQAIDALRKAI